MRLRNALTAFCLLLCGWTAARGQSPLKMPDFTVPHDSRDEVPDLRATGTRLPGRLQQAPVLRASVPREAMPAFLRRSTCYAIRSYDYTADHDGSGRVVAQGSSTCQPSTRLRMQYALSR